LKSENQEKLRRSWLTILYEIAQLSESALRNIRSIVLVDFSCHTSASCACAR
jgi:hypothetical protein